MIVLEGSVIDVARESLRDELESALIYGHLANRYRGTGLSEKLRKIAKMEGDHAAFWADFLRRRGVDPSGIKPRRLRIRLYMLLFRLLGLGLTIKLLENGEIKAIETYARLLESPDLSGEEAEELKKILADELLHEEEFATEETRLKEFMEHVRDAVLGMSDGVVEILSVSAGLAGAYGNPLNVALGGLIVGIAGSLSMGIGAFSSVRAQRQVRLGVLSRIVLAVKHLPGIFIDRIKEYMVRKGFSEEAARVIAEESVSRKDLLKRIIAEEEYGIREETLEHPGKAGLYTGLFYIVGAIIPLIPYFLTLPIGIAIPLSFVFAATMMAFTGFIIAVSANLDVKMKMIELVAAGLGAAAITFIVGRVASVLLSIEVE